jgi:hypothetical protein
MLARFPRRSLPQLKGLKSAVRVHCSAFPSPELPTFNGLYPPIVARQVSQ